MIKDTGTYVLSMISVFAGCITRDFIIPLFVWQKHLKGKGFGYCYWFCILTQSFIQINLVTALGMFDILNRYTFIGFNLIIYSMILWNYSDKKFFVRMSHIFYSLRISLRDGFLIRHIIRKTGKSLKNMLKMKDNLYFRKCLKKSWPEILLVGGIICYDIWFMTYNLFTYHCYQFPDIPVHQSWIYELEQGNIYADGIYPFGMHIVIYFLRIFFHIRLREILLYAGAYNFAVLILGIYLLAREIFAGKYIPVAEIWIVSLLINQARYSASLPQEAGMYVVAAIGYFMVRFLHKNRRKIILGRDSKLRGFSAISLYINRKYIDPELILLMMSVSLVISYHYYTAIAAVFVIAATGLAYIAKILKKQYFVPLFFSGLMGALIAVVPISFFLLKGIPFQESINWAKTVMAGEKWLDSDAEYQYNLAKARGENVPFHDSSNDAVNDTLNEISNDIGFEKSRSTGLERSVFKNIKHYCDSVCYFCSEVMFGNGAGKLLPVCIFLAVICALILLLIGKYRDAGCDYLAFILIMLAFLTLGASEALGIRELIEAARASVFAEPFTGIIYMLPVDFLFRIFNAGKNRPNQPALRALSLAVCYICVIIIVKEGWYHNFFEVSQTYYNEVDYVLKNIRKSFDKYSYTVVSPTDEYYEVIDHGRHTELSQFVNMIDKNEDRFTFTTEYVFFFIEKEVLKDYSCGSVRVDPEYALKDFVYTGDVLDYYYQRAVIESKAYYWAKMFRKLYPRNFKIYFEDDIYVVYLLEQNTYYPYDLQIEYLKDLRNLS